MVHCQSTPQQHPPHLLMALLVERHVPVDLLLVHQILPAVLDLLLELLLLLLVIPLPVPPLLMPLQLLWVLVLV